MNKKLKLNFSDSQVPTLSFDRNKFNWTTTNWLDTFWFCSEETVTERNWIEQRGIKVKIYDAVDTTSECMRIADSEIQEKNHTMEIFRRELRVWHTMSCSMVIATVWIPHGCTEPKCLSQVIHIHLSLEIDRGRERPLNKTAWMDFLYNFIVVFHPMNECCTFSFFFMTFNTN